MSNEQMTLQIVPKLSAFRTVTPFGSAGANLMTDGREVDVGSKD